MIHNKLTKNRIMFNKNNNILNNKVKKKIFQLWRHKQYVIKIIKKMKKKIKKRKN